MKSLIRSLLLNTGLYYSIKSTVLYDFYLLLFLRIHWNKIKHEMTLLTSLVGKGKIIFDVGANGGSKTDIYRRIASKVICIEPDKQCLEILKERFKYQNNIILAPVAIGDRNGKETFYVESTGSCVNTLSKKWKDTLENEKPVWWKDTNSIVFSDAYDVDVTSLDNLISLYGMPDYIKLDVEGFELQALKGLSHPIKLLSFEANLPVFLSETLECLSILNNLSSRYKFAYSLEEGLGGKIYSWFTYEQIETITLNSDFGFLEILAWQDFS